jgi:hypothetical protein
VVPDECRETCEGYELGHASGGGKRVAGFGGVKVLQTFVLSLDWIDM